MLCKHALNYVTRITLNLISIGTVGETTSIELNFFNERDQSQKLAAKAVQMRYDVLASQAEVSAASKQMPSLTPVYNIYSHSSIIPYIHTHIHAL